MRINTLPAVAVGQAVIEALVSPVLHKKLNGAVPVDVAVRGTHDKGLYPSYTVISFPALAVH